MPRRNWKFWQIPVTDELDKALGDALVNNAHVSKSEYVRDVVRMQLRDEGYLVTSKNRSTQEEKIGRKRP